MKLDNTTPWPAKMLVGSTGEVEQIGIAACKATYQLKDDGLVPVPTEQMWKVIEAPTEFRGVMLGAETDFRKQGVDMLVFGTACAPGGKSVTRMRVEIECGPTCYRADVIGDRQWTKNGKRLSVTEPSPFATMPITNDRAFGGKAKNNGTDCMHVSNPDGRGLCFSPDEVAGVWLPNLERPDSPIQAWNDSPVPACFYKPLGLLPDNADMFQVLAASPDKLALPKAVAFRGFNQAVPGLVIPAGQVGKTLRVSGFDPGGDVVFPLPAATAIPGKSGPVVHVAVGDLRARFPLSISTLMVFVPERLLMVTYIGLFRYLFRPTEIRTAELRWYGSLEVPTVRGVTGDASARGQGSVLPSPAKPVVVSLPPPLMDKPVPPPPALPPASPLLVVKGVINEQPRLTVLLKRTYQFAHGQLPVLAQKQLPLSRTNAFSEPPPNGGPNSVSEVVEAVAYKSGTDVVVRGQARPPEPVTTSIVSVSVGTLRHQATVLGKRTIDYVNGRLIFTPQERFSAMPLRYENAYGGSDPAFDAEAFNDLDKVMTAEQIRRTGPLLRELYGQKVPPFVYPRNRLGKGYVLVQDPQKCVGRELPNIEFTTERLTAERIMLKNPRDWQQMPMPAGFDFLDPLTFPRSAMMGLPPMTSGRLESVTEVITGQVPGDYCRGNIFETEREKIPALIHPDVGRCAPIGLRCPFLRGNETLTLTGMDAKQPELAVRLPGERPHITATVRDKPYTPEAELFQVFIDVDNKLLTLIWGASLPLSVHLNLGEETKIQESAQVIIQSTEYAAPQASPRSGLLGWLGFKG